MCATVNISPPATVSDTVAQAGPTDHNLECMRSAFEVSAIVSCQVIRVSVGPILPNQQC